MTVADLWNLFPLLILAAGALTTLLVGALFPGRAPLLVALVALGGSALWPLQGPAELLSPLMGIVATPLARLGTTLFSLLAGAVLLLSVGEQGEQESQGEEYPATVLFTTFAMVALAGASNLLTLFLALEAMTFGFYLLVAMDLRRALASEAGLKYLLVGAVSAAFLAMGIALIYLATGSLALPVAGRGVAGSLPFLAGWGFLLVGIAFKLSLVPAHLWTPDVYQGAPAGVIAFLSAGSKGATILLLLLLLPGLEQPDYLLPPLRVLALLSMVVGNLAALFQNNIRRMLAYSSIAQMGYVVLAFISGSAGGYRAAAYYGIAYGLMSLAAFGAIVLLERGGSGETLESYHGLGRVRPVPGLVLTIALFALAGIPPTAGFTGKFLIFAAALKSGETFLALAGILTAAASVYYYLRVVVALQMRPSTGACPETADTFGKGALLATVAALIVLLGLFPSPLLRLLGTMLP
jgi:NADH-quinone oxidoreductase subunit N